jgi:hypothetical protein
MTDLTVTDETIPGSIMVKETHPDTAAAWASLGRTLIQNMTAAGWAVSIVAAPATDDHDYSIILTAEDRGPEHYLVTLTATVETCLTCNGRGFLFSAPEGDESRAWVEACMDCDEVDNDDAAARAAAELLDEDVAYAVPDAGDITSELPYLTDISMESAREILAELDAG